MLRMGYGKRIIVDARSINMKTTCPKCNGCNLKYVSDRTEIRNGKKMKNKIYLCKDCRGSFTMREGK
jgi:transposase-like protein